MTVVEVVGVRPNGQTSLGAPVNRHTFASAARGLSGLLVITINFMSGTKPLVRSTNSTSSRVFPELEINNMISFLHTIPRSPCCASLGCKKKAGVPVELKVVAIFKAICPAFPIPLMISFPPRSCTCFTISDTASSYPGVTGMLRTASASCSNKEVIFSFTILLIDCFTAFLPE